MARRNAAANAPLRTLASDYSLHEAAPPMRMRRQPAISATLAIFAIFGHACLDRALPAGGRLAGSAGASGTLTGGGGAGGAAPAGTGSGGATAGGAGGSGGAGLGCARLACPEIFCTGGWVIDDRGCQTCTCAPGPKDCVDVSCGPRPLPPSGCPAAAITCVPHGEQCVWSIECPLPPCPAADCGPSPDTTPRFCNDRLARPPACLKDPDGVCRWNYLECPPSCVGAATPAACDQVAGCHWLVRGCSEPTIPATGCVDKNDIGCIPCLASSRCVRAIVDSCSLPDSAASDCADAVCRDVPIAVCAWW
jgi:hypothetical protein